MEREGEVQKWETLRDNARTKELHMKGKEKEAKYRALGYTHRLVLGVREATIPGNPTGPWNSVHIRAIFEILGKVRLERGSIYGLWC